MKPMAVSAPVIALVAILLGTIMDAVIKGAANHHSLVNIVFWRFTVGAVLISIPFFVSGRRLPGWKATRFHALRSVVHITAAFTFFFSLTKLELAEATTLGFSSALFVAPIARVVLGEAISSRAVIAALIGFVGVGVAVSGEPLNDNPDRLIGVIACLTASVFYALSLVMLRVRAAIDGSYAIAVYANLFPALYMIVPALLFGSLPAIRDAPLFLVIGAFGSFIWILMSLAYARAEAQLLAPLEYSALIWSALLGWAFFNETPAWQVWVGAAIVIAACALVMTSPGRVAARSNASKALPEAADAGQTEKNSSCN